MEGEVLNQAEFLNTDFFFLKMLKINLEKPASSRKHHGRLTKIRQRLAKARLRIGFFSILKTS